MYKDISSLNALSNEEQKYESLEVINQSHSLHKPIINAFHPLILSRHYFSSKEAQSSLRAQRLETAAKANNEDGRSGQRERDDVANSDCESNIVCLIEYPSVAHNQTSLRTVGLNRSAREAAAALRNGGELRGIVFPPMVIVFPCSVGRQVARDYSSHGWLTD